MDARTLLDNARDSLSVRRVFGEPYERDGITVIPVARVQGGGGGGLHTSPDGEESGGGFGLAAHPVGVYVIIGDTVRWEPALDINRIVLGGQVLALVALLTFRSLRKDRTRSPGRRSRTGARPSARSR